MKTSSFGNAVIVGMIVSIGAESVAIAGHSREKLEPPPGHVETPIDRHPVSVRTHVASVASTTTQPLVAVHLKADGIEQITLS